MSEPEPPSSAQLLALIEVLRAENATLAAQNAALAERVAELEARLGQNPRNSSRPPSSEGLARPGPKPRSLRKKSGRRPGGQNGHDGSALRQVTDPDRTVVHEPGCCGCGRSLDGRPVTGMVRRQCFDLPPLGVEVTEHQLVERECVCGQRTRGTAPQGVQAPTQYGPRVAAIVVYLFIGQFLSRKRTAQALAELFGTPISAGTVSQMTERAAGGLGGFLDGVRDRIAEAEVVGFDETGLRVAGRLAWVHCARTDKYTLLICHARRGRDGIDALGVLPRFGGIAVHDAWAPYDTYADVEHQLCCAHAVRELQAVTDTAPAGQWCWADQVADALVRMQHLVTEAIETGQQAVDPAALAEQIFRYRSAAVIGVNQTAARSGSLMKKHNALAHRLIDRQDDYLRFTGDWRVPPDNNGSERDIRMTKLRQKVSGCLRTLTGAEQFCAIRSYLATAAKHGLHFYDALVRLTTGQPWTPAPAA